MEVEPTLAAACAECVETTVPATPGAATAVSTIRRYRSGDGRQRVDYDTFSMISNPATGERILLDHALRQARILPIVVSLAGGAPAQAVPGVPFVPGGLPPALPAASDPLALGKMLVNGLEVEGVRHLFAALDGIPSPIGSWEVWTDTGLQMPVFTQTIGSFGVRTCICKCLAVEPPQSVFQIPPDYVVIAAL